MMICHPVSVLSLLLLSLSLSLSALALLALMLCDVLFLSTPLGVPRLMPSGVGNCPRLVVVGIFTQVPFPHPLFTVHV